MRHLIPRIALGVCLLGLTGAAQEPCSIERIAGGGDMTIGEGPISAVGAHLEAPIGLAVDAQGSVYFAEAELNRVFAISAEGILRSFAGTGAAGFSGDGGPAEAAELHRPQDVAISHDGAVLIVDTRNGRVRSVEEDGTIQTFAGDGSFPCSQPAFTGVWPDGCGNGGPATLAQITFPRQIAAAPGGSVYVMEASSSRPRPWLRRISPEGVIDLLFPVDLSGGPNFADAITMAADPQGRLLVSLRHPADSRDAIVYFDSPSEFAEASVLSAYLPEQRLLAFDAEGSLYGADALATIRRVDAQDGHVNILMTAEISPLEGVAALALDSTAEISGLAVGPDGDVYFAAGGKIYRIYQPGVCALPARPEIAVEGVRHGASFKGPLVRFVAATGAPGQIIAIFGRRLGPAQLVGGQIENGFVTTETGGVRVLIDGQPAPLLFASEGQLGAVVPYSTSTDGDRLLEVEVDGVLSEPRTIRIVGSNPGIFTLDSSGQGPAAALNQNGSLNTADNPARIGEIIVLWATGEGQTNPAGVDGLIAGGALPQPILPVKATIGGLDAEVLYAGAGPGMVAGAMQLNLRVPSGQTPSGPPLAGAVAVVIEVGDNQYSQALEGPVTVFVQP